MDRDPIDNMQNRALTSASSLKLSLGMMTTRRNRAGHDISVPPPSSARLAASLTECPYDLNQDLQQAIPSRGTVLYLQ